MCLIPFVRRTVLIRGARTLTRFRVGRTPIPALFVDALASAL